VYGSDAIGGVINLITKTSAKNGSETHLKGGAGSNGYGQGELRTVQSLGQKTDLNMLIGYERTDGFDVVANAKQPDRDGFNSKNGQLGLNHTFNDAWSADFNAQRYQNLTEFDGRYDQQQVDTFQYDGGLKFQSKALTSRLEASYGENASKSWEESKGKSSADPTHTGMTNISWINSWSGIEDLNLTGGVDWQREQVKSDSRSGGQPFTVPDRDNTGAFVVGSYVWSPFLFELSGRTDDNQQYGRHNTWSAASGLDIDEHHNVRLSYGTAFKAPSFMDLYYGVPAELKPEESKNLELGLSGRYSAWDWSVNLYHNRIDNLIYCLTSMSYTCNPKNTTADIKGVETELGIDTGPVHHRLSYDYTRAKDTGNQDLQLLRRAEHKGSWIADTRFDAATLTAELLYVGKRYDNNWATNQRVELGAYTLLNLAASYEVTQQFTLGGRIDNLFDRDYAPAYGYASPGTEFKVTADYRF
jgi:vitamin B12 transporter